MTVGRLIGAISQDYKDFFLRPSMWLRSAPSGNFSGAGVASQKDSWKDIRSYWCHSRTHQAYVLRCWVLFVTARITSQMIPARSAELRPGATPSGMGRQSHVVGFMK